MKHIQTFENFLNEGLWPIKRAKEINSYPYGIKDVRRKFVEPILGQNYTEYRSGIVGRDEFRRLEQQYGADREQYRDDWDFEYGIKGAGFLNGYVFSSPDKKVIVARAATPQRGLDNYLFVKD